MISEKHTFLFAHRPKTVGNLTSEALLPYSSDLKTVNEYQDGVNRSGIIIEAFATTKHTALKEFRTILPDQLFHRLHEFSTIRNPFERAVSSYF